MSANYPAIRALDVGAQVDDYVIIEPIARGGYGVLYRAEHPLHGEVAFKAIYDAVSQTVEGQRRFFDEARLTGQVEHENIVSFIDCGTIDHPEALPGLYIVTELLSGVDLQTYVEQKGPLDMHSMLLVSRQLADALARHGVERIEAEGLPFDPSCHEAMLMVDDASRPAQTVAQVLRHGYRLHGRVVRPAQVVVARGGPAPERPAEEAPDADV